MRQKIKITPELQELLKSHQPSAYIANKTGLSLSWVRKYRAANGCVPEINRARFHERPGGIITMPDINAANPVTVRKMTLEEHAEFMNIHAVDRRRESAVTGYIIGSIYKQGRK